MKENSRLEELRIWTDGILREMSKAGFVKAGYLAISRLEVESDECFGEKKFGRSKELKKRVHPANLFRNMLAQLA